MRKLIRKILFEKFLYNSLIKEDITDEHDYYEILDDKVGEAFYQIKKGDYNLKMRKINPNMYKKALQEFMKFKDFPHFPTKYIFQWKKLVLENIATLKAWTEIMGHSTSFPFDEFHDTFNYNRETGENDGEFSDWVKEKGMDYNDCEYNYTCVNNFLSDVYKFYDEYPVFSNGQLLLSDFGLPKLLDLAVEIIPQQEPTEIIITINKILDVTHPRSDLAELFIHGGSDSLDDISNN